ncbi:MAG: NUDIX domain-containing protein [Candidatus Paceibacterota bacterium]
MKEEVDFYQVSLKLFLKNNEGEILGLRAKDDSISAGFYDLPGGRINTNEFEVGFPEILKREVKEELGDIKFKFNEKPIAISRNVNLKTGNRIVHIFFEANYIGGEITTSDEHLGYKWINLKEVELNKYFSLGILDGVMMYVDQLTHKN